MIKSLILATAISAAFGVQAQHSTAGTFAPEAAAHKDLKWPGAAEKFTGQSLDNKIFQPANPSSQPSPAVILLHSCAGITNRNEGHLKRWVEFLTNNGFVVMVPNHLETRGAAKPVGAECSGKTRQVKMGRLVKDIYDGVEHLGNVPGVDKNRIFTLGFSLGGMSGGLAASPAVYDEVAKGRTRPRAIGSLYGACQGSVTNFLPLDSNLPVLWLMGKDDTEAPAANCEASVKSIKARVPQSHFHVYDSATHSWDVKELSGTSRTAGNGVKVTYLYNEEVTKDSMKRTLDFFNSFK